MEVGKARHYLAPVIIAGVAIGMVIPSREDEDQPHTHVETHAPESPVGVLSIDVQSSSSAFRPGQLSWGVSNASRSRFTLA